MSGAGSQSSSILPPKPLVFVPGFPGSAIDDLKAGQELFPDLGELLSTTARPNLVSRLSGPDDLSVDDGVAAGEPIRSVLPLLRIPFLDLAGTFKQAQALYDILAGFGYAGFAKAGGPRFRPVGWDWRRPVDDPAARSAVGAAVRDLHRDTGEPVTILCHSTGGLVVRAVLEHDPTLVPLVERVIALAVPWAGTLQSLPYLLRQQAFSPFTTDETQTIVAHSWAAYDLLPPDPAPGKSDMTDADGPLSMFTVAGPAGQVDASPVTAGAWMARSAVGGDLPAMQARARSADARLGTRQRELQLSGRSLEVVCMAGFGAQTATTGAMDAQGNVTLATTDDGDGTVPRRSAAWLAQPGGRTFYVPIGGRATDLIPRIHIGIWLNEPVQAVLANLLARRPWQPYTCAEVDADDLNSDRPEVRVHVVAQGEDGKPLANAQVEALELNGTPPKPTLIDPATGRGLMVVKREDVVITQGGLWRFSVQFHWQDATGRQLSGTSQPLLLRGPESM